MIFILAGAAIAARWPGSRLPFTAAAPSQHRM
jgi:hypothetical protein